MSSTSTLNDPPGQRAVQLRLVIPCFEVVNLVLKIVFFRIVLVSHNFFQSIFIHFYVTVAVGVQTSDRARHGGRGGDEQSEQQSVHTPHRPGRVFAGG
jgi:hypothetical protein